MATFLSIPAPLQTQPLLDHRGRPFTLFVLKPPLHKNYTNTRCQATPSPSVAEEEEEASPPQDDLSPQPQSKLDRTLDPQFRGCKTCGSDEIERGCNGEGRIQGGIATVPGFGWWPIKAYRPCPGFVASGGRYRRRGQSMDEVASGRGRREASIESSSKRRQESRDSKGENIPVS